MSEAPAIGIDLGTSYCCVAVYQNQEVEVIPNSVGQNTTPSYVAFNSQQEILVGSTAKDKAHINPQDTIYDVKRMCGRHFDEEKIQRLQKYWPFTIVKSEDGKIKIKVQDRNIFPEQVLTEMFIHLKETADEFFGEPVKNAVITVPAYFNPRQRDLTKEACNKAGLNVLLFISEPAAAAVAYGLHLQNENDKRNCLIFDLGGGTLDVAVLELHKIKIKIKAIGGDPFLGGKDFDNAMIQHCIETFKREHKIDLMTVDTQFERDRRLKRIKMQCEEQKRNLSTAAKAKVAMDNIHGEIPLVVPFTRDIFSELIRPLVDRCIEVVEQTLSKCEVKATDIHDVMVVGGSSRIPYVQSRLTEKFGGRSLLKQITQEEAVAPGAAILAFNIENPEACLPNVFIQELNFLPLLFVP